MPSTHSNLLVHMIFSTKNRLKLIADNWRPELHGIEFNLEYVFDEAITG